MNDSSPPHFRSFTRLRRWLPVESEVILLGSIATGKYVDVLMAIFGDRLRFPSEFIGRGDMSRGGLMLRCAMDRQELSYVAIAGAIVNGKRPPKLTPRSYADKERRSATGRIRQGCDEPRGSRDVVYLFCIAGRCEAIVKLSVMDVSGTIRSILNQKSDDVFSISPDATVLKAVEMMDAKNVGALLVMDQERLVGIISERDYTRKVMLRGKRSRETKVAEIMSSEVTVTNPREPVEKCLRLMTDKHIRHLPVVEDDKVVGVISIGDLVKHVISCQSAAIAHLEHYIHGGYAG